MPEKICMGGICGMGMAPLALFLKADGCEVFGYDDAPNANVANMLSERGIALRKPCGGERFDRLVISSALKLKEDALRRKYPFAEVERRGLAWAKLCSKRRLTAVVGSHGKSTVSAMIASAAIDSGMDFGWLVGAVPKNFDMSGYCQEGKVIVSEIDESDGTIEHFSPEVCVALNSDLDHVDTYAGAEAMGGMFRRLFARTTSTVLYPKSDVLLDKIAQDFKGKAVGVETPQDFTLANAAMARAAYEATFKIPCSAEDIDKFKGLERRQEILAQTPNFFAVGDYAHHPREVASFLGWFNSRVSERKTIVFQPHRYTRTKYFAKEFARILEAESERGNRVLLLPVYAASEKFDADGESCKIAQLAPHIKLASKGEVCEIVEGALDCKEVSAFAFVGAGDFYFDAKKLIEKKIFRSNL